MREVYEETGLTLLEWKLRGIVTFVSNEWETEYMFLYTANNWSGELTDCNEGSLAWKHKSEFNNLPMWEDDKIFLKLLREQNDFFSLKLSYEYQRLIQVVLNGKNIDL